MVKTFPRPIISFTVILLSLFKAIMVSHKVPSRAQNPSLNLFQNVRVYVCMVLSGPAGLALSLG